MNFGFDDEQLEIKRTAIALLADRCRPGRVREHLEIAGTDGHLWQELAELGWTGIAVAEEHGGQGLGLVELTILLEELASVLAPVPFLSNAAAGLALEHGGTAVQRERWLPGVAAGSGRGAIGVRLAGGDALVLDGDGASVVVVVDAAGGGSVHSAANLVFDERPGLDSARRLALISGRGGEPLGDTRAAHDRIAVALAAELTGLAQRALDLSVDHARERRQYGRPVGAFQAVSHRCAQMYLEVEGARSATYYAAWAADHEPESLPLAASMAKAFASDAGFRVTASAVQVHGGVGFTWEHDLHFLLKRARSDAALFGTAREHRDRVATFAGLVRSRSALTEVR